MQAKKYILGWSQDSHKYSHYPMCGKIQNLEKKLNMLGQAANSRAAGGVAGTGGGVEGQENEFGALVSRRDGGD